MTMTQHYWLQAWGSSDYLVPLHCVILYCIVKGQSSMAVGSVLINFWQHVVLERNLMDWVVRRTVEPVIVEL